MVGLNRLNPSLDPSDHILVNFFPSDINYYNNNIRQDNFKEFLKTDGTTEEGRNLIATYYNVLNDWNTLDHNCDFVTDYYNLLLLVKNTSINNKVWISFIEGLHRHAAIVACLLCAKFDFVKNILVPNSLTFDSFNDAMIPNLKSTEDPSLTPEKQLCDLIKREDPICMLRTPISVKVYIPKNITCDVDKLFDTTKKLSALVSTKKRESAIPSMSKSIASGMTSIKADTTSKKEKSLLLDDIMKYQEQESSINFNTRVFDEDDSSIPKLPICEEYIDYAGDPFNDIKRQSFIDQISTLPKKKKNKKTTPPCHSLSFEVLTKLNHYDKKKKKRSIDWSHVNGYIIVPVLVHCITTKLNNLNIYNLAERDNNHELNLIKFLTRYVCGTRKSPSVQLHVAIKNYCPDAGDTKYIQGLTGTNRVIPVTLFLVTLYNASFTFDTDKSKNLLVSALERFDLSSTVGDDVFLDTMGKSISSASFSKLEIHAQ